MSYVGVRRFLLLAVSFLLFVYLGLNLLLNVSFLAAHIQQRVASSTGLEARVSYLYVNWRGNPVAHRVDVGPPDGREAGPRLTLNRVETAVDWKVLLVDGPKTAVTTVRIDRVRARMDPRLTGGLPVGGGRLGIPVRVNQWELTLNPSRPGTLRLHGDSALFSPTGITKLRVNRIGGKAADVELSMQDDRINLAVHQLSLPDAFWELDGDRWSGRATVRNAADGPRVEVSLSGRPGRLRGVALPDANMSLDLHVGDTESTLRDFSFASSFLRLSVTGSVRHSPLRVDLVGEGRAPLQQQLQRVLFRDVSEYVRVERMSPIRTRFRVSGSPGDLRVIGQVTMDRVVMELGARGGEGRITVEEVRGNVVDGEVRLEGGRGRFDGGSVSLRNGRLYLEDGAFHGAVSLFSRFQGPPGGTRFPTVIIGAIGELNRARFSLETSFRVGPRQADARLRLRDGFAAFDGMVFEGIRGRSDVGSRGEFNPHLRATFRDGDQNRWRMSGRLLGPLFLRGREVRFERWLEPVDTDTARFLAGTTVEGAEVRGVLSEVGRGRTDYSLVVEFDGARLRRSGRSFELGGRLRAGPGEIRLNDVRLVGAPGEELRVWGDYAYDAVPERGRLDLKLIGREVPVLAWLSDHPAVREGIRTELDVDGRLEGSLSAPRYRATFHRGTVEAYGLHVSGIRGTLEGDAGRVRAKVDRLAVREGGGTVALDWGPSGTMELRGGLRSVPPGALVPPGTWVDEHATGRLDVDVALTGRPGLASTWSGTVALAGRDLRLSRFPPVEGIEEIARVEALQRPIAVDPVQVRLPIREGKLSMNPLKLTGSDLTLNGSGTLGFDGTLNLRFELILAEAMLQRFLQDVLGDIYREVGLNERPRRLTCPFVVTGTLRDPEVELKREEINKNFRENLVNSLVTERLGKPLNELLEEIPFFR